MTEIAEAIKLRVLKNTAALATSFDEVVNRLPLCRSWINYFWPIAKNNPAIALLVGAKISMVESAAAWGTGANRGAAISLRSLVENLVAWEYYRDHPVEFGMLNRGIEDLMLPKAVRTYLGKVHVGFEKCQSDLFKAAIRSDDYYYSTISSFAHAHPAFAGLGIEAAEAAISVPPEDGFLTLCLGADEFVSDIFATRFRKHWDTLPIEVQKNVSDRLKDGVGKWLAA